MVIDPVPMQAYSIQYGLVGVKVGRDADPSAYVSPTKSGKAPTGNAILRLGKFAGTWLSATSSSHFNDEPVTTSRLNGAPVAAASSATVVAATDLEQG